MIAATLKEKKAAKIKFFATYIASIILIIMIFAALWKNEPEVIKIYSTPSTVADNGKIAQADAFLHTKQQQLDDIYTAAAKAGVGEDMRKNLLSAENTFETSLDSLERVALSLKDEQQKDDLNVLVSRFRSSLQSRSSFMNTYVAINTDSGRFGSSDKAMQNTIAENNATIEELKGILMDKEQKIAAFEKQKQTDLSAKDKIISSLQAQLAQKPTVPVQNTTAANDGEWKQKHSKLKATYDNLVNQNIALNKSFKILVEDNRRLLSRLQGAKNE